MAEWLVRGIQNLLIAVGGRSNPRPSRICANSRFISIFSCCMFKGCFLPSSRLCLRRCLLKLF